MFARRGYLLELTDRIPKQRTFFELVDVLARYRYTEFWLYGALPPEEDGFDFGRLEAYCRMQGVSLGVMDGSSWKNLLLSGEAVAAATESAFSLAGRVETMRERMAKAEALGRSRGAHAFFVTDFADGCAWHPPVVSLPGIILGGNFASAGHSSAKMDLERELNGALDSPLGGMLLKLGTLYLCGGAYREDRSEYFNILAHDHGYSRHPGVTQRVLDEVSGVVHGIRIAADRWVDRSDAAREIAYAAGLIDAACHRRDEGRLRSVRDEHGRIWRLRFLESGRVESLSRLPRF